MAHGPELPRRAPDRPDARHRHPRADPPQGRHHAAPPRPVRPRRLLPGYHLRRWDHLDHAGRRVHRQHRQTGPPELFCLATDLHDDTTYPAQTLAEAYHWRWIGSETTLKEAKSAINGAGPSTGAILRSGSPALVAQEHAAWVTAVELTRATARATAALATPAARGRRAGKPVHPRQISFTAARRAVITTTRTGTATASLPTPPATTNQHTTLTELARRRITIDRDRHRERKTKARPGFPAAGPHPATHTAPAQINICKPLAA